MIPSNLSVFTSRQRVTKHNVFIWSAVLVAMVWIFLLFTIPNASDFLAKLSIAREARVAVEVLEQEVGELQTEVDQLIEKIKIDGAQERKAEEQLFPETIDSDKIARILELFSLQLSNLDTLAYDSIFSLQRLSFSETQKAKEDRWSTTSATISFSTDIINLGEIIKFLQTSRISPRFVQGVEDEVIDPAVHRFLLDNLLPISNITAISATTNDADPALQNITMQVVFYSQP